MKEDVYFYSRIKDLSVAQFCKKHNLQITDETMDRVKDYLEIVHEDPIYWITEAQEKEIVIGYIHEVGVDLYWKPQYSADLMKQLRECLENDIPIVQLMGRASFCDKDIHNISIIKSSILIHRLMSKERENEQEKE